MVGCKCIVKNRDTNVMVHTDDDDRNGCPLCIDVGLEDVDSTVTSFFGGSQRYSDMVPSF